MRDRWHLDTKWADLFQTSAGSLTLGFREEQGLSNSVALQRAG
jgi:hypothetical protein